MWPPPKSRSGGGSVVQLGVAIGQRLHNLHPGGGSIGEETSPVNVRRGGGLLGSATGTAAISAFV